MAALTGMAEKMGSRAGKELPEVYRFAVNFFICVIFKSKNTSKLVTPEKAPPKAREKI